MLKPFRAKRVGPFYTLDFQFAGATAISSQITFTRASTGSYFNSAGVLSSAAVNEARLDYNPSTLAAQGLLIEEARTNSIRNNTMVGAAAGTPGTLPTNWTNQLNGLSQTVVGTGTSNGISYIDIRLNGTTSSTGAIQIKPDGNATISAATAQAWAMSSWMAIVGGSTANTTGQRFLLNEYSLGPTYLRTSLVASNILANGATLTRISGALTTGALTTIIEPLIVLDATSGAAIDITLRIGLPQLELGAFATSVIPTTTTALTRAADVASVNTLSPWYNSAEGTLYAEVALISSSYATGVTLDIVAGGAFGTTEYITFNGTQWLLQPNTAPVNVNSIVSTTSTAKVAAAIKVNDSVISANGLIGTVDTACAIAASPTTLTIGKGGWSGSSNYLNGYLRRIVYYPRRLANAELQALTA